MAKTTGGKSPSQSLKQQISTLRRKGLYNPRQPSAAPTRHAKRLVKEFADVLNKRAKVVTVPKVPTKTATGQRAAEKKAHELAAQFGETMRAKGAKVIVKTASPFEKASFSKTSQTIVTRYRDAQGQIVTHEYVPLPHGDALPDLNQNERYSLPFARGKNGVYYVERATKEEINALANQYETKEKNPFKGASGYIQIVYPGTRRKVPRKRKEAKASNVVPISNARRRK